MTGRKRGRGQSGVEEGRVRKERLVRERKRGPRWFYQIAASKQLP